MSDQPARASIVSGYFNPLHQGHLDMIEAARERTGYLIVIVNNDTQQLLKKGRVIQDETNRARIVRAMRAVDDVLVAVDDGPGIERSLDAVRAAYPDTELEFCNGGDRSPEADSVPAAEAESAQRNRISMHYGVGGSEKADSSTRITAEMEAGS
jgi:glycerol-3-phosphate cytidylyltransferase/D-beta-D-heptose 7-phosphate kinase/D-beta-D-heptose 1-phosphate adenosyltransferase